MRRGSTFHSDARGGGEGVEGECRQGGGDEGPGEVQGYKDGSRAKQGTGV